jgi:glycerophosphoryl diester phosphodiesterase
MKLINNTKIIAHQGHGDLNIRNTIPAFLNAISLKTDMIELDIHETRDGKFIVFHDNSLDASSPQWKDLTYLEVCTLTGQDKRVSLLSECLEVIGKTPIDLEIKSCLDINNLIKELSDCPLSKGSVISSMDLKVLRQLHEKNVSIPLLLIIAISLKRSLVQNLRNLILYLFPKLMPKYLNGLAVYHLLARKELIRTLKIRHAKVFVWTVDELDEMKKFISLGVDGIITNRIDLLKDI